MKRKMDVDNTALPPIEYAAIVRGFSRFAASKISAEYAFLALSPLLWLKNSTKETIMTGTMTSFLLNSLKIISLVLRERLQASCIYIYILSTSDCTSECFPCRSSNRDWARFMSQCAISHCGMKTATQSY